MKSTYFAVCLDSWLIVQHITHLSCQWLNTSKMPQDLEYFSIFDVPYHLQNFFLLSNHKWYWFVARWTSKALRQWCLDYFDSFGNFNRWFNSNHIFVWQKDIWKSTSFFNSFRCIMSTRFVFFFSNIILRILTHLRETIVNRGIRAYSIFLFWTLYFHHLVFVELTCIQFLYLNPCFNTDWEFTKKSYKNSEKFGR